MTWVEQISNEIWTYENFLPDDMVDRILADMRQSKSKNLVQTKVMGTKLKNIGINYNSYDYVVYQYDIRHQTDIIGCIADRLDEKLLEHNSHAPRVDLNAMQCFVKSFAEDSHYDIHVEPAYKYGEWAYIHFLSDEINGELIFPNQTMIDEYFLSHEDERSIYDNNLSLLQSYGEQTRIIGPFSITPSKNKCILFRTGSVHWANPVAQINSLTRPTVTGWPHATSNMIADLDKNCNINEHMGANIA
jgi:hypothetical protein